MCNSSVVASTKLNNLLLANQFEVSLNVQQVSNMYCMATHQKCNAGLHETSEYVNRMRLLNIQGRQHSDLTFGKCFGAVQRSLFANDNNCLCSTHTGIQINKTASTMYIIVPAVVHLSSVHVYVHSACSIFCGVLVKLSYLVRS